MLRGGFPVNVLNAIKLVPEVCGIYCATANPVSVVVAVARGGLRAQGLLGADDGQRRIGAGALAVEGHLLDQGLEEGEDVGGTAAGEAGHGVQQRLSRCPPGGADAAEERLGQGDGQHELRCAGQSVRNEPLAGEAVHKLALV